MRIEYFRKELACIRFVILVFLSVLCHLYNKQRKCAYFQIVCLVFSSLFQRGTMIISIAIMWFSFDIFIFFQRQSERIKRGKTQAKRRDDVDPLVRPDLIVPVARFHGSRLASGPSPSPFQESGSSRRHRKAPCLSSEGATVGAALVEAENSLETEVCLCCISSLAWLWFLIGEVWFVHSIDLYSY